MLQLVQSSGERSELTHTPTGAIWVEDLKKTSNEDSPAKPPNVSIPLPTAYYHNYNWRTWTASIDKEAILKGVDCSPPTRHSSVTAKEKAAKETHLQKLALVQTELEEYKRSSEASIKRNKDCRARSQPGLNYSRSRRNYGCYKSFTRRLMKAMQQAPLENVKT
ncbi:hypothetical protein R1flu_026435 [Riccia fluitans]|uniref:Uncharacterized protein n=1 Tax=Riccia fluitans TaxID=41844 RepID=A0ABD1XFZ4_9MARC